MWVGPGPWDQTEDDNPGRTLCGPANGASQMGGEKRDIEREGERERELESRKEGHHPPDFFLLHFRSAFRRSGSQHEASFCEY